MDESWADTVTAREAKNTADTTALHDERTIQAFAEDGDGGRGK